MTTCITNNIYKTNYQNTYVITFTSVKGQIYITYALRYYVLCTVLVLCKTLLSPYTNIICNPLVHEYLRHIKKQTKAKILCPDT